MMTLSDDPRRPLRTPGHLRAERGPFVLPVLLLASLTAGLISQASAQEFSEYQVKAAFLYNFTKFVDWPPQPAGDPRKTFTICVLGDDPFRGDLEKIVEGKSLNGRAMAIRHISKVEDASGCQIAFISYSEKDRLRSILNALRGSGVLTVGDIEGFAEMGGVINFTLVNNHVHFEVNLDAAKAQRLNISSRLLRLAQIVRSGNSGG
jgi:YfiR/HmsC-like